jgi:acetoin utilization protein AcuB
MMNEPVSSIMTSDLITLEPNDTLSKVREVFSSKRIHHLPVVDNGNLVGLITTYDLFRLGKASSEYGKIKVKDVMTTRLARLEPNAKIGTAAEIFLENLFHALPIVEGDKLVGIVTTFDVLRYEHNKEYPSSI